MKLAAIAVALGVASAPAFAGPTKMSDEQMDNVTGGQLVDVTVVAIDVVDVANNDVAVQAGVNANAAVAVLGTATSRALQTANGVIRQ